VKNAGWNVRKWWWYLRIIDENRGEPELRPLMLYIPQFYDNMTSLGC
jgi:hypothetical protein